MEGIFDFHALDSATLNERQQVRELVEFERYCRDYCLWDIMMELFLPDSTVRISWFEGSGREFVERSKKMGRAKHKIYNTVTQVSGSRAMAEILAQIQSRQILDTCEVDLLSNVKLLYRLIKSGIQWKILSIDCVYENDSLVTSVPRGSMVIDDILAGFRQSYKCLSFVLSAMGTPVNQALPGIDRPETIEALYNQRKAWLDGHEHKTQEDS